MQMKSGKTALVLAGGGLTGAVYEIGALRAIDDLLVDRTVNDFDIYVGTSAGALVASMLANGITPDAMLQVMHGSDPDVRPIARQDLFNLSRHELVRSGLKLPRKVLKAWTLYLRDRNDITLFDFFWSLLEALPSGLYDSMALERYLRHALQRMGYPNQFEELARILYIIATNLDNGERAVFGPGYQDDVPISLAVAASSAMPLFYRPVSIGSNEYVDGGLRGNASLDLAIEEGATLVVCINPIVPFNKREHQDVTSLDADREHLSERGIQAVSSQMLSILLHSGLHYHVKQLRRRHRDVDIILIEPRADDDKMHFYNIMRYSARLTIARHGFETVTLDLAEDFAHYEQILARHNIPVSRRLLVEEMQEIWVSNYDPQVLKRILYERGADRQRREKSPLSRLSESLAELTAILDEAETNTDLYPQRNGQQGHRNTAFSGN
jgi:predicted acylesterase/phospholipase RssA